MGLLFHDGIAVALVFRPSYRQLEAVFLVFLAVCPVSFLGSALWVGFDAGRAPARHGPDRHAGAAQDLQSLARSAGDGRRGRRVADEPRVSRRTYGGERLARAALPARAALRPAARHPRHAGAQLQRCGFSVPSCCSAGIEQLEDAEPADRRPRARRGPALLPGSSPRSTRRSSDTPSVSAAWACAWLRWRAGRAVPSGAAGPRMLLMDRAVVSGLAAGLDAAGDAGIRQLTLTANGTWCCCPSQPAACGGSPRAPG